MSQSKDTLEQLTSAVRRFVREVLVPAEPKVEEDDDIPQSIVAQLKELGMFGMTIPEVMERIRVQAYDIWTLTPDEFAAFLRLEHAKWGKIVKLAGAKAD